MYSMWSGGLAYYGIYCGGEQRVVVGDGDVGGER